jgi:twitching motility protein PilI
MTPFDVLADYERRSLAHVAGLPEQIDAPGMWRGVGYRIGSHRLASGFEEVLEILTLPSVTPVPGAQPWLLGLANVRGSLLPVVDLKQFLEGERTVLHEGQRILLVRQSGGNIAVLIDELYGQRSFMEEQPLQENALQESPPEAGQADTGPAVAGSFQSGRYQHFVDRAYRLDGATWGIFSLDRLTRTPEFRQAASDMPRAEHIERRAEPGNRNTLEVASS